MVNGIFTYYKLLIKVVDNVSFYHWWQFQTVAEHCVTPSSIKLNLTLIATPEEIPKVIELSEAQETYFTKGNCMNGKVYCR